jgi:shikimate kinase
VTVRAVLVGLPGSGKTTVGRRLAALLDVPFADSDELIEARTGRRVPDIFAADGEHVFRVLEEEAVAAAMADFLGVLALGGGAVLSPVTRSALKASGAPVVLLGTRVTTLAQRLGDRHDRPLLTGHLPSRLAQLAETREPLYREVATLTVDTERRGTRRVAEVIAGLLGVAGPVSPPMSR